MSKHTKATSYKILVPRAEVYAWLRKHYDLPYAGVELSLDSGGLIISWGTMDYDSWKIKEYNDARAVANKATEAYFDADDE